VYRLRLLVSAAGILVALAACGTSHIPDRVTPELRSILRAGLAIRSCAVNSSNIPRSYRRTRCVPRQSMIVDISAADNGQRLAIQYLDGHVVVWNLLRHSQLLRTPPAPTQDIWLTDSGSVLALDLEPSLIKSDFLQLWRVEPRATQGPVDQFSFNTDWVWADHAGRQMLILPNWTATEPGNSESSLGRPRSIMLYDLLHHRSTATADAPPVPPAMGTPQPRAIGAVGASFDRITGTFVISSGSQAGFITWKPGSRPIPTRANCVNRGILTNDGRVFACVRFPTRVLSVWDVRQRRIVSQWRPSDMASAYPWSIAFVGDRLLAVAESRHPPAPYIVRIYQISNHRLLRTLALRAAPTRFFPVQIWVVGQSLVAEQDLSKFGCDPLNGQACITRFFVFSLS
jgi:hypothetical protein